MKQGVENCTEESKTEKTLPELLQEIRQDRTENFRHFVNALPSQSITSEIAEFVVNDLRLHHPNAFKAIFELELINEKLDEQTALLMTQILNDSKVNFITFYNNELDKNTIGTIINMLKNNPKNESLVFQNMTINFDAANVVAKALNGSKFTALAFNNTRLGDEEAITIAKAIKEESHVKFLEFPNNSLSAQGALSILNILQGSSVIMLSLAWNNLMAKEKINVKDYTKMLTEALKHNIRHLDLDGCMMDIDSLSAWGTALKQSSIKSMRLDGFSIKETIVNFVKHLVDSPIIALDVGIITDYHLKQLFAPLKESKIVDLWFHGNDIRQETINELNNILSVNRLKSERANAMLSSFYLSKLGKTEVLVAETQNKAKIHTFQK